MSVPVATDMYFEVLGETKFDATVNHDWEFKHGPYNVRTKLPDGRICTKIASKVIPLSPNVTGF